MGKFHLGEILQDKITGFKGVAMCKTKYLTGCTHYGLAAQKLGASGKPKDWEWFDEIRLVRAKKGKIKL